MVIQNKLAQTVQAQFQRLFRMLRAAIKALPEAEWCLGDLACTRPDVLACHLLEWVEFYFSEVMQPLRFDLNWEAVDAAQVLSQQDALSYLAELEQRCNDWLLRSDLLVEETVHPWTAENRLGKALYVLRHTQHHTAEISLEATRRGFPPDPAWQ